MTGSDAPDEFAAESQQSEIYPAEANLPDDGQDLDWPDIPLPGRVKVTRQGLAWLAVVFLTGVAAGAVIVALGNRQKPAAIYIATAAPRPTQSASPTPGMIHVYVSGEVENPAVYELPAGSILQDAVEMAGGFSGAADREVVNLALGLSEGMHVHIPGLEEETSIPLVSGGSSGGGLRDGGVVQINLATVQELETLPGIGPSLAQAIVDYRELNGAFVEVEQIMEVPGIGQAKYEAMKELITVE